MTFEHRGGARIPGPLGSGIYSGGGSSPQPGARLPGPIGNQLWDKDKLTPTSQTTLTKAVKRTVMPPPTNDHDSKDVHVVTWPLFNGKVPVLEEVKQAPGIANCPVASILAALAFTPTGRTLLQGMVSETAATVVTDVSGLPRDTLSNPPPNNSLTSARFFTVKIPEGPFEVSDVLYTDDHDSGWSPLYLRDPAARSIWASIIEKALAVRLKSYENFDAGDLTANEFWQMITGAAPGGFPIVGDTPLAKITDAAMAATRVPSIAASKPDSKDVKFVAEFHGFAMMGLEGSKVKLFDPAKAKTILLSPTDFRHDFQAILFRR